VGTATRLWSSDEELFELVAGRLHAAVVSDVLDALGHRTHTLDGDLRPLDPATVLVGRADPLVVEEVEVVEDEPYDGVIAALDDVRPGEVVVLAAGGTRRAALWGELFSVAASARGARGTIVDGPIRDQHAIAALGYPIFSRGASPLDCAGRAVVAAHRTPAACAGLEIDPGDLIVGDADGIVVVPRHLVDETVSRAVEKASVESTMRDALAAGRSLREAYDEHRVL
jgi:4-hydroxy-4-methyl-2-oxoglutarate aldolase